MSDRNVSKSSLVFSAILDNQGSNDSEGSQDGWFTVSEIESGIEASRDTVERRVRDLDELGHLDSRVRAVGGLGESPTEYRLQFDAE